MISHTDNWALALSGGGARGVIHIGVLHALEAAGLRPHFVAGTSMGAIVASLYCAGLNAERLFELVSGVGFLRMFSLRPNRKGLLEMSYLQKILRRHLPERFEQLSTPLLVTATDLARHKLVSFTEGPLADVVLASASIPLLFKPVEIDGCQYVDGGLIDNLPAAECQRYCRQIVGVEVNKGSAKGSLRNMRDVAQEVFHLIVENNSSKGIAACTHLIQPTGAGNYPILDFANASELYKLGIRSAEQWLEGKDSPAHNRAQE